MVPSNPSPREGDMKLNGVYKSHNTGSLFAGTSLFVLLLCNQTSRP